MDGLSYERCKKSVMTIEQYLAQVLGLVERVRALLSEAEYSEVMHLINHDEPAEGLRALAWIIHEEQKTVTPDVVSSIIFLIDDMVPLSDLPPDFKNYSAR